MAPAFVVLAALSEETDAILRCIKSKPLATTATVFHTCHELDLDDHNDNPRRHGVIAQLAATGRVSAAVATVHAIHTWNPSLVLIAGTAGGFRERDVALGDILVATKILDYEAQRLDEGSTIRWADYEPDAWLRDLAESIHLPPTLESQPRVRFGAILSGDKVVASEAAVKKFLGLRAEVLGVEMEGAGVAFAAAKSSVPFLMIRGIADYADEKKREDSKLWSKVACDSAARFVRALLERWADEAPAQTRANQ